MYLFFLELDTNDCHLDFKLLEKNLNAIIPRAFYLQLLSEDNAHIR